MNTLCLQVREFSTLYLVAPIVITVLVKVKVKCSHYRPGVAQRVSRGITLLFHNRGTRRG